MSLAISFISHRPQVQTKSRTLPAEIQFTLSQTPMPLAYVPMINTEFSDRMNLKQRTFNLITYLVQQAGTRFGLSFMDPLVQKYVDPNKGTYLATTFLGNTIIFRIL